MENESPNAGFSQNPIPDFRHLKQFPYDFPVSEVSPLSEVIATMFGKGKPTSANKGSPQGNKSPGANGSPFCFAAMPTKKTGMQAKAKPSKLESTQNKFITLIESLNEEEFDDFREFVREELDFGMQHTFFSRKSLPTRACDIY